MSFLTLSLQIRSLPGRLNCRLEMGLGEKVRLVCQIRITKEKSVGQFVGVGAEHPAVLAPQGIYSYYLQLGTGK